jgi:hypothetical protein
LTTTSHPQTKKQFVTATHYIKHGALIWTFLQAIDLTKIK